MMTRNKSSKRALAKYLPILPLMALAIVLFANRGTEATFENSLHRFTNSLETGTTDTIPNDVLTIVDEMPEFPGCEKITDPNKRQTCCQQKLMAYLYSRSLYPESLRDSNIHGTVNVQFVVQKDGFITGIEIAKGVHPELDQVVMNALAQMQKDSIRWKPGIHEGEVTNVKFTVPIYFVPDVPISVPVKGQPLINGAYEYLDVDDLPSFPTEPGQSWLDAFYKYTIKNLKYPTSAKEKGLKGSVYVQFIVEKDGSISDISIKRGLAKELNEAAMDVFHQMNRDQIRWIPGKKNGEIVRTQFVLPVEFSLSSN